MKKTWVIFSVAVLVGCGGDANADGTTSGDSDSSDRLDGIELVYQGEPLILDNTTNACLVASSGGSFSTGSQLPPDDSREFLLSFNAEEGSHDWSPLGEHGSVTDAQLMVGGGFDLVDLDDGLRQMIASPAACTFDVTFLETDQSAPFVDRYDVAFKCPLVPYIRLNRATGELAGEGSLSQFSGTYKCFMSKFDDRP